MSGKMSTKSSWPTSMLDNNANKIRPTGTETATAVKPAKTTPATTTVKMSTTTNKNRISTTITRSISRSNSNNNNSNYNNNNNNNNNNTNNNNINNNHNNNINSVNNNTIVMIRPNTLNVSRDGHNAETKSFIREALNAWRTKARCNVVPAERLQELFHELQFNPSERQISEMLQTAKVFARKGSKQLNGLTFGEFCVLAADLKRFRTCSFSPSSDNSRILSSLPGILDANTIESGCNSLNGTNSHQKTDDTSSNSQQINSSASSKPNTDVNGPEVFLGGSCNPTTWRADVAIPTLQKLGISFYNPQVSDWTPDLIELEHRAKEKARVLFFVMDSETRASAGAIEAAHIAGQNARQLVLVLHPYKPNQCILNEPVSAQEYLDLSRNQQLLRELVTRRGLPVLDNIPSGLQRTKAILAGIRDPPLNISSILIVVRGAFDRVANSLHDDEITIQQCQRALSLLGYADSLLSLDNLRHIIKSHREALEIVNNSSSKDLKSNTTLSTNKLNLRVNYDEFCVLAAYLSVLQQEIYESGCISPIKGINLPPPPIFLTNMQEGLHNRNGDDSHVAITTSSSFKQIFRTSSNTSVPDDRHNRDSGTSSPQPLETGIKTKYMHITGKKSKISLNVEFMENSEESDSNDSVFSSGSSINSTFFDNCSGLEFRDVYLGGSCNLRSKWRHDYAIPYLNSKGVTYHMPCLHESFLPSQLNVITNNLNNEKTVKLSSDENSTNTKKSRAKRKERSTKFNQSFDSGKDDEDDLEQNTSPLAIRPTLYNPMLLDSSRVLLFVITNDTRSLAPMTLAAHCIGLMYNVVLCVQMLPEFCVISNEKLTPAAIKDYNRGRSYLVDLAKRQGVPVFNDLKSALECAVERVKACNSRNSV